MLKTTAIAALAGIAATATAQFDTTGLAFSDVDYTATSTRIGDVIDADRTSTLYENQAGPYASFPDTVGDPLNGPNGTAIYSDNYTSIATQNISLEEFIFVGGTFDTGLNGTNDGLGIFFFDTGGNFVDAFSVAVPDTSGAFVWTITLGTAIEIEEVGFVQINVLGDDTGDWFLTEAAAGVGDNGAPVTAAFNGAFTLVGTEIPTPGAVALAGFAGLAAARRRR